MISVEEFYERMRRYFVKDSLVWLSIEEARYWGLTRIYYTLRVEPVLDAGYAVFEYIVSTDSLIPIAVVLELRKEDVEKITLDKLSRVVRELEGFIYGGGDTFGVLIPLNEWDLEEVFDNKIPKFIKELFNVDMETVIDGYYLDLAR